MKILVLFNFRWVQKFGALTSAPQRVTTQVGLPYSYYDETIAA